MMTVRCLLMAEHFVANCREQERTVRHERDTGTRALFLDVLSRPPSPDEMTESLAELKLGGAAQHKQDAEDLLWTLFNKVDFARIAQDMGALGIRVEQASAFPAALAQALSAQRPAVIDVVTDIDALAPVAIA